MDKIFTYLQTIFLDILKGFLFAFGLVLIISFLFSIPIENIYLHCGMVLSFFDYFRIEVSVCISVYLQFYILYIYFIFYRNKIQVSLFILFKIFFFLVIITINFFIAWNANFIINHDLHSFNDIYIFFLKFCIFFFFALQISAFILSDFIKFFKYSLDDKRSIPFLSERSSIIKFLYENTNKDYIGPSALNLFILCFIWFNFLITCLIYYSVLLLSIDCIFYCFFFKF